MYNLQTSNITNKKFISLIKDSDNKDDKIKEKIEKIKKNADLSTISYIIFKDLANNINEKLYNIVCISLTLGDELPIPIPKKICDILFFAACTNADKRIDFTITNINQAKTLYEIYENDYNKIEEISDTSGKRFSMSTLVRNHSTTLFPGQTITWKIPVAFYRVKKDENDENSEMIQKCTLSGIGYCEIIINDETYKIPRSCYMKFFKNALVGGRLICSNSEEIKSNFDSTNSEALLETLEYCGYRPLNQLNKIIFPNCVVIYDDNIGKITAMVYPGREKYCEFLNNEEQSIYWKECNKNNNIRRFCLLPNLNYIALISDSEYFRLLAK